jgi:predicted regulator of Ras-like GTPase activity (Roadblock/LC7/MglB family)
MQMMRERLVANITQELETLISSRLGEQFQPMVGDVSQQLRKQLELESPQRARGGELYQTPDSKYLYYWVSDDRKSVEAGAIYEEQLPEKALEDLRQTISDTLGSQSWSRVSTLVERFRRISEETEPFPAFNGEIMAARTLASAPHRKLLQQASRRAGVTLDSITAGQDDKDWNRCVEDLESQGLLQREFQVYCRDTGIQLCKFANKDALDEAIHMGFRSFSTGRLIADERIVQLLTVSEKGKFLSKTNLWLALCLAQALQESGVEAREIRWTFERDYRTINIFACFQDTLCMFEMQEEMVSSDQAFRFVARTHYFQPDAAVLVTPTSPKRDATQLLAKARPELEPTRIIVLQNLEELNGELGRIVLGSDDRSVRDLLDRFEKLSLLDVAREVSEHLLGVPAPASLLDETSPDYMPGLPAAETSTATGNSNEFDLDLDLDLDGLDLGSSSTPMTGATSIDDFDIDLDLDNLDLSPAPRPSAARPAPTPSPVAAVEPMPAFNASDEFDLTEFDDLLDLPPSTPTVPEPVAVAVAPPVTPPAPVQVPEPEPAPVVVAEPEPVAPPTPVAPLTVAPAPPVVQEPSRDLSDLGLNLDLDLDLDLDDLDLGLPPVAPTPQSEDQPREVLPEVASPLTEKSPEERFETATRKLIDELTRKGIAAEVDDVLQEIREVPGCAAQVSTNEGLVFHGALLSPEQSDMVAAFQTEVFSLFQQALQEAELGQLEGMIVEGGHGRLQVTPVKAEETLWVSTFERVQRPEEPMASFPGEITLREAILKKVLEDLGQVEGIQGNLVTSRDGLPVEAQLSPDLPAETIGVLLTQTLTDSEAALERLQLTPLRQILLRSDLWLFSLIPLDRETILITLLDPAANRDTWQARLQGAATMLASVFH